ncbi:hypothetical protein ACNHUS_09325 [Actinomycetes bacterium M1A6_2h]
MHLGTGSVQKKYGWGISPHTWEGWVIVLIVAVALVGIAAGVMS